MKDPATAIPKGTLLAIGTTYVTYILYGLVVAFTYSPYGSGVAEEYSIWTNDSIPLEEKMLVSSFVYGGGMLCFGYFTNDETSETTIQNFIQPSFLNLWFPVHLFLNWLNHLLRH